MIRKTLKICISYVLIAAVTISMTQAVFANTLEIRRSFERTYKRSWYDATNEEKTAHINLFKKIRLKIKAKEKRIKDKKLRIKQKVQRRNQAIKDKKANKKKKILQKKKRKVKRLAEKRKKTRDQLEAFRKRSRDSRSK